MTVVFGLGTRLPTKLKNDVLCNGQRPGQCCDNFINQGQFKAIKTLKSRTAPCCDKHQFRVKVKKERKKEHFVFSCLLETYWQSR